MAKIRMRLRAGRARFCEKNRQPDDGQTLPLGTAHFSPPRLLLKSNVDQTQQIYRLEARIKDLEAAIVEAEVSRELVHHPLKCLLCFYDAGTSVIMLGWPEVLSPDMYLRRSDARGTGGMGKSRDTGG